MPPSNPSPDWILWRMFLGNSYNPIMQFSVLPKNSLHPFQKINPPHNTTFLWNQNFLTHHNRSFTKIFYPPFWKVDACRDITKSGDKSVSQTNSKPSDNDSMMA